jgi:hypothetical protein
MQLATRFRLLLVPDIAWLLFFFACCLSDERVAKFVGMILLIVAGRASGYAQRMIGTMTLQQMRIRACVTIIRYLALSAFLIWVDFTWDRDYPHRAPPGALSILLIPILLIFCYVQVRTQLGLEPLMPENEPKPPNQSLQPTAGRSDN